MAGKRGTKVGMRTIADRRQVLIISRKEDLGEWFQFFLGGRRTGMRTTLCTDLGAAIRFIKRSHPSIVVFVEEDARKDDDQLMLLRALLLMRKQRHQNTLAMLYDPANCELTLYHNLLMSEVSGEDVALAVQEATRCPLFGYCEEALPGFPANCGFLPFMARTVTTLLDKKAKSSRENRAEVQGKGIKSSAGRLLVTPSDRELDGREKR